MDVVPVSLDCNDDKRKEELCELLGSHGVEVKREAPYQVLVDEPLGWASLEPETRTWERCVILSHNCCPAYQLDLLDLQPAALITSSTVKSWLHTLASLRRGQRSYPDPSTPLTRMERRTLQLVARGHTNCEIAAQWAWLITLDTRSIQLRG